MCQPTKIIIKLLDIKVQQNTNVACKTILSSGYGHIYCKILTLNKQN